jgi:hypothetical protein
LEGPQAAFRDGFLPAKPDAAMLRTIADLLATGNEQVAGPLRRMRGMLMEKINMGHLGSVPRS